MFDAEQEALKLRKIQKLKRKQRFQPSKLDAYKYQLLALHQIGESLSRLQIFLSLNNIKVSRSTIHYWLKKNGEIRII